MQAFGTLNSCAPERPSADHPPLQLAVFPYQPVTELVSVSLSATPPDPSRLPRLTISVLVSSQPCAEGA
jgi:hypothetical protein